MCNAPKVVHNAWTAWTAIRNVPVGVKGCLSVHSGNHNLLSSWQAGNSELAGLIPLASGAFWPPAIFTAAAPVPRATACGPNTYMQVRESTVGHMFVNNKSYFPSALPSIELTCLSESSLPE